jgi:hypothetical protein
MLVGALKGGDSQWTTGNAGPYRSFVLARALFLVQPQPATKRLARGTRARSPLLPFSPLGGRRSARFVAFRCAFCLAMVDSLARSPTAD